MAWLSLTLTGVFALVDGVLPNLAYRRRSGRLLLRHGAGASGWLAMMWVGMVFLAGPIADLSGLPRLAASSVLVAVGIVLATIGIAIVQWAQRSMGDSLRIGVDPDERTGLVTLGIFRWVRNPIYSAMIAYSAGTAALVPNVASLAALGVFVVSMEYQVRMVEEPYLTKVHGAGYLSYATRVGRFVPGIGSAGSLSM